MYKKMHNAKLLTLWKSHRNVRICEEDDLRYGYNLYDLPRSVNEIALKSTIEKEIYHIKKDAGQLPISFPDAVKHSTLTLDLH